MPSRSLFYPAAVLKYFNSTAWYGNHFYYRDLPSIAFCFGRTIGRDWYVITMQSDLSCTAPSAVRDHFRGWRNVLFANVVAMARGRADAVHLCLVGDVARGCFPGTRDESEPPTRWRTIYDGTAADWRMQVVTAPAPVNIQIYNSKPSVYAQRFHQLRLTDHVE
jgi:hypothetical protein